MAHHWKFGTDKNAVLAPREHSTAVTAAIPVLKILFAVTRLPSPGVVVTILAGALTRASQNHVPSRAVSRTLYRQANKEVE